MATRECSRGGLFHLASGTRDAFILAIRVPPLPMSYIAMNTAVEGWIPDVSGPLSPSDTRRPAGVPTNGAFRHHTADAAGAQNDAGRVV